MERMYVVAFPEIAPEAAAWVEELRAGHDPSGHAMLKAHFTFVFGCTGIPVGVVEHAMRTIAADMRSIEFSMTRAISSSHCGFHYVLLCPDKGTPEMTELHGKLHSGPLASCLDPNQQFTPHMTVCKTADAKEAEQVLVQLRSDAMQIVGRLPALTLGAVLHGKFERLREVALMGTKGG